jgi:drug/metabolite transporter (DMT)-like permease
MFLTISVFLIFDTTVETLSTTQVIRITFLIVANLSAFTSFTWLIRRVSALQVASVDYLVPIIGVSAGVIFLDESFNFNVVIAGAFIFVSLILNTKEEFSN